MLHNPQDARVRFGSEIVYEFNDELSFGQKAFRLAVHTGFIAVIVTAVSYFI